MVPINYAQAAPPRSRRQAFLSFALRMLGCCAVGVGGWCLIAVVLAPLASTGWMLGALAFVFVSWVFTLVWLCRGGWILGGMFGFICGISVASYGGACMGPILGAIGGAAAMPLTPAQRRNLRLF